jgi:hypothetical protein
MYLPLTTAIFLCPILSEIHSFSSDSLFSHFLPDFHFKPSRASVFVKNPWMLLYPCFIASQLHSLSCASFFFLRLRCDLSQGFALAKQALYSLNHTSSSFCSCYFWIICLGQPLTVILFISDSQVSRIIGMSHQNPACPCLSWLAFLSLLP